MKSLLLNTFKLLAVVATLSVYSCGDDEECVTCTLSGSDDVEICDPGGVGSGVVFDAAVTAQEAIGFECN